MIFFSKNKLINKQIFIASICTLLFTYPLSLIYEKIWFISFWLPFLFIGLNTVFILINFSKKIKYPYRFVFPIIGIILSILAFLFESYLFDKADLNQIITFGDKIISSFLLMHMFFFTGISFLYLFRKSKNQLTDS